MGLPICPGAMLSFLGIFLRPGACTEEYLKPIAAPCPQYFSYCICKMLSAQNDALFNIYFFKFLGLAGFLPLHPMTVTNAERFRKKKAQEAEKAAENEEGEKEDLDEKQEQQQQQN